MLPAVVEKTMQKLCCLELIMCNFTTMTMIYWGQTIVVDSINQGEFQNA
jgi:hypothetical protein